MNALRARLRAVGGPKSGLMQSLGLQVVAEAKRKVPRKTGDTGRSIRLASYSAREAEVRAGGAAPYLEGGTRAHVILPRRKKVLFFSLDPAHRRLTGSVRQPYRRQRSSLEVFARRVRHPGTRPRPFLGPAIKTVARANPLAKLVAKLWNEAA